MPEGFKRYNKEIEEYNRVAVDIAKKYGFDGVHYQFVRWNGETESITGVDGQVMVTDSALVSKLGFSSLTHYQFVHFTDMDRNYEDILEDAKTEWKKAKESYDIPYFPHVSCGWDNNPRFRRFKKGIVKNNTPENIEKGMRMAKEYLDAHPGRTPLVTVNSWNEWTETSYLEPDDLYGYGYLEAIKKVFCD